MKNNQTELPKNEKVATINSGIKDAKIVSNEVDQEVLSLYYKLIDGYSKKANSSNKIWISLIVLSITLLLPKRDSGLIDLPFGFGNVESLFYYTLNVIILSSMLVVYTNLKAQMIRAKLLAKELKVNNKIISGIYLNDITDAIEDAPYDKIAPILQYTLGNEKSQFLHNKTEQKDWRRKLNLIFFFLIKIIGVVIIYVIPFLSLFYGCYEIYQSEGRILLKFLAYIISIFATIFLLSLIVKDIVYAWATLKKRWKNEKQFYSSKGGRKN